MRNASPIIHAVLGFDLLLAATVPGIYKPFGMTAYGLRRQNTLQPAISSMSFADAGTAPAVPSVTPLWIYIAGAVALALALLIVITHLTGAESDASLASRSSGLSPLLHDDGCFMRDSYWIRGTWLRRIRGNRQDHPQFAP